MISLIINGKESSFNEYSKLPEIINSINITDMRGIALSVNFQVIPKEKWDTVTLTEGDKIDIIRAFQGG